ncbi:MAG: EamA family transporter [Pseudomonadota bacterium]
MTNGASKQGGRAVSSSPTADQPLVAAILLVIGTMFIPLGDAFAKLAAIKTTYTPIELAWMRFVLGAAVVMPLVLLAGGKALTSARFWGAQLVRGALIAGTIICIITAVTKIPLADAFGAFFVGPAVATILSRTILGEAVRPIEWAAVLGGFLGVMIILKPGASLSEGQVWALSAGALYGSYLAATRWPKSAGPALSQLAGQLCIGAVLVGPFAAVTVLLKGLQSPDLLLGSGLSSVVGNLLIIMAFAYARAGVLTPLVYCQLIAAVFYGWYFSNDIPTLTTVLGIAVIFTAGMTPLLQAKR